MSSTITDWLAESSDHYSSNTHTVITTQIPRHNNLLPYNKKSCGKQPCIFSARQHAERAICYRKSVCPSVRPSVCLSHKWISRKRLKLGSCNFHRTVATSLQFLQYKFCPEILTGSPPNGGVKQGWVQMHALYPTGDHFIRQRELSYCDMVFARITPITLLNNLYLRRCYIILQ